MKVDENTLNKNKNGYVPYFDHSIERLSSFRVFDRIN